MTRRRGAAAIVLGTIATASLLVGGGDARALEGEEFTVFANTTTEVDQGAIPASDPASSQGSIVTGAPTPDRCATMPSCMVVPVNIEIPEDIEPGDDFVVAMEFSWVDSTGEGLDDLDFWVFDDGQTAEREGTAAGYTEVGSSAGADNPEKVGLYEPTLGRYNIVANNFSGVITSWHIKAVSSVGEFETPFESLAPAPGGAGTVNPNNKPTTTTTTARPTTSTTAAAAQGPTTTAVSIPEGVVLPDDDFDGGGFDPDAGFTDAEVAGQPISSLLARPPAAPSAMTVILWMGLLPLVLVAAIWFFVVRRRSGRGRRRAAATA